MDQLALFEHQQLYFDFYNETISPSIDLFLYTWSVEIKLQNLDTNEEKTLFLTWINTNKNIIFDKYLPINSKDIYAIYIKSTSPLTIINYAIFW